MAKEFKTVKELVELLASRGIIVDEATEVAIKRESYYAIVNGYKSPFLDRRAMEKSNDDVYLTGTRFEWIYDLFLFDRELRSITFSYLAKAEAIARTSVVYAFCESHQEGDAYLNKANFCDAKDYLVAKTFKGSKASLHARNLSDLMKRLDKKINVKKGTRDFIRHYVNKYGFVPLWVLSNDFAFGNIIHFYQLMQPHDRRRACKFVAEAAGRIPKESGNLSERDLLRALKVLNEFRNLCAHDERLYCARIGNDGYYEMLKMFARIVPHSDLESMLREVFSLFESFGDRLHVVTPMDLLKDMGFDIEITERSNPVQEET